MSKIPEEVLALCRRGRPDFLLHIPSNQLYLIDPSREEPVGPIPHHAVERMIRECPEVLECLPASYRRVV